MSGLFVPTLALVAPLWLRRIAWLAWIPWDALQRDEVNGLAWLLAAIVVSLPAAIGAIAWVQAWRGSAVFGPPRCRRCQSALRGHGSTLPPVCPECGAGLETAGHGVTMNVDYATRRWSWSTGLRGFVGGAAMVGIALFLAGFAATLPQRVASGAKVTSYARGMSYGLLAGATVAAAEGGLRFAADVADSDPAVRKEAAECLQQWLAGSIHDDRGLPLLFASGESALAGVLADLVGALVVHGDLDADQAAALLERVAGRSDASLTALRQGGSSATLLSAVPALSVPTIDAVDFELIALSEDNHESGPGMARMPGEAPVWSVDRSIRADRFLLRWIERFVRRTPEGDVIWKQRPRERRWRIEHRPRGAVVRLDEPLPKSILLPGTGATARLEPVGSAAILSVDIRVRHSMGWELRGTWYADLADHRIVLGRWNPGQSTEEGAVAGSSPTLSTAVLVPANPAGVWPTSVDLVFEPDRPLARGGATPDGSTGTADAVAGPPVGVTGVWWPRPIVLSAVDVQRP